MEILGHDHTLNIFRHQWRIQGGLGGGQNYPLPPIRPDACLELQFFIDRIVYH